MREMNNIWIVVHTYRGLIQNPEIFFSEQRAKNRAAKLIAECNPDYDAVEVFGRKIALLE